MRRFTKRFFWLFLFSIIFIGWNISSSIDNREVKQNFLINEQIIKEENHLINPALMEAREKRKGKYLKPIERTVKQMKDLEKAKIEQKPFIEKIRAEVADMANSKEKNQAIVFKYFSDSRRFEALLKNVFFSGFIECEKENKRSKFNRKT